MVRCRVILQVLPAPAGKHYDHCACKQREFTCKHKNSQTFEGSFNTRSKSYAPQPATLAGQEETPRWLSSIPKCVQSRNCCPAQKFPQNIHCTQTCHSQTPSQNKRCSEARAQSAKLCLWVNPGSSTQHFYTCFPQILTPAPKGSLPNTLFVHLKRKLSTSKAAAESNNPKLAKAASPSHSLSVFSDSCEFLISQQLLYVNFKFNFLESFPFIKTILSEISQTNTHHADHVFSWALQYNIYSFIGEKPNPAQPSAKHSYQETATTPLAILLQFHGQQSIQECFMQPYHHEKWHKWNRDHASIVPSHPQMSWPHQGSTGEVKHSL